MWVEVLVRLIVPDPSSFTVLDTLQRKFGLRAVANVSRLRAWDIELENIPESKALRIVERLLAETTLLANPNRDRYFIRSWPGGLPGDFWKQSSRGEVFVIKVIDIDDIIGRSKQAIVRRRLGIDEVKHIRSSTIWLLEIAGAASC